MGRTSQLYTCIGGENGKVLITFCTFKVIYLLQDIEKFLHLNWYSKKITHHTSCTSFLTNKISSEINHLYAFHLYIYKNRWSIIIKQTVYYKSTYDVTKNLNGYLTYQGFTN